MALTLEQPESVQLLLGHFICDLTLEHISQNELKELQFVLAWCDVSILGVMV